MKLRWILMCLLAYSQFIYGQTQTVIAKFIIQEAYKNNIDVSQGYIENNSYFVFYITADKQVYFGSIGSANKQQSYGAISNLQHSSTHRNLN